MSREVARGVARDAAIAAAATAALYLVVFATAGPFGFVNFDDPEVVHANPVRSWDGLGAAFTERMAHAWLPLYALSLGIDNLLFGPTNPGPWHAHSALLHALNAALVVGIARRLGAGRAASLLAGLLFGLHPAVTESVAWVASRKDLVSFAFAAGSVLVFLRAEEEPRRPALHALGALLLGLGMLAKGTVVVVPALLALAVLARASDAAARRRGLLATLPYAAMAIGLAAVHYAIAAAEGAAGADLGPADTTGARAVAALAAFGGYLRLLVIPFPLSADHGIEPGRTGAAAAAAGALLLVGALAGAAVLWRRGRRGAAAAILGVLCALAPFNGLFPRTTVLFAERYLYVAAAVACGLIGGLLARAAERVAAARVVPAFVLAGFAAVAAARLPVWKDSITLWEDAVAATGGTHLAHAKLGEAYAEKAFAAGDPESARALFARSYEQQRAAAELARSPLEEMRARLALGLGLLGAGKPAEALVAFERAGVLRAAGAAADAPPGFAASIEVNRAKALEALGREEEAVSVLQQALAADPNSAAAWTNLGVLRLRAGHRESARVALLAATKADEKFLPAYLALADLFVFSGDPEAALRTAVKAAGIAPSDPDALAKAGEIAFVLGQPVRAEEWFRNALALSARHPGARRGLAGTLAFRARAALGEGKPADAVRIAAEATEADPAATEPWLALGDARRGGGNDDGALEAWARAGSLGAKREAATARAGLLAAKALAARAAGKPEDARALLQRALDEQAPELRAGGRRAAVREGLERIPPSYAGGDARLHFLDGLLALLAGEIDAAIAAFDRAIAMPSAFDEAALVLRSRARSIAGDLDGAVADLERLVPGRIMDVDGKRDLADEFLEFLEKREGWTGRKDSPRDHFLLGHMLTARAAVRRAASTPGADRDSAAAAAHLEKARRLDPALVEASLALAELHFVEGRVIDALREANGVLARDPDRVEAHLLLASIMKAQFAEAGDRSFRDAAEDHYRRALAVEPNDARALAGLGEIAAFSERPKEALAYALRAHAADPDLAEARALAATLFLRVGRAHLETGDAAAAAEAARRADVLNGETASLCLLRAEIARKNKDWSAAGVEVERARALDPSNGEVRDAVAAHYRDVGYALLLHGRKDQAMESFRRALAADAPRTDLSEVRKVLERGEGRPEEPVNPAVAAALEKSFVEARGLFDEGIRARAAGDLPGAEAKFRASLRAFETAQARFGLGLVLADRGDAKGAEAEYAAATAADPDFPDAWLNLGSLRFKRGDDPGAALAWTQYLRRAPKEGAEATVERVRALLDGIRERAEKQPAPVDGGPR